MGKSPFEIVCGFHPRGGFELREFKDGVPSNGHGEDFSKSMREVHESFRKALIENDDKLKQRMDGSKR